MPSKTALCKRRQVEKLSGLRECRLRFSYISFYMDLFLDTAVGTIYEIGIATLYSCSC